MGGGGRGARKVATVSKMWIKVANSLINSDEAMLELDSNAGTTVLVKGCLVVHDFDRPVNFTGYDTEYDSKFCRTMTGVLDYDHPQTSKPYFMVINKAIHLDHLEHHLMCPMQYRMNGIKTN